MASSTLSLSIDKGPKRRETLAFNPGTIIRIGRVVTGNTLAIKDPGISQKHLTVCFLPEITRWVVTDLGSSNGTYVNGALISPNKSSLLSDGDVIKIGECTSISVNISAPVAKPIVLPRCERPPRPSMQVKLEDKEWEENVDEPSKNGERARAKRRKGGGSTRVSRKDEALESVVFERRVTRSLTRAGSTRFSVKTLKEEEVMIISNSEFVDVAEKGKQSKEKNAGVEEEVLTMDGENNCRVEKLEDNMDSISKKNNAGVEEEVPTVDDENNSRVEEVEDNMDNTSIENNSGVEEEVLTVDGQKNSRIEEIEDNMDNMTLGEWFDRMEEYLPKAINKVAEEIIAKLREKAQLFDEYASQTSNLLVE